MSVLNQRFIDLLNVPKPVLLRAVEELNDKRAISVVDAASMTVWQLVSALSEVPRRDLENLTEGYLYAGRTSVAFFRLDDRPKRGEDAEEARNQPAAPSHAANGVEDRPVPLSGRPLDADGVDEALNELTETGNAFSEDARPQEISRDPSLVWAQRLPDGRRRLRFVMQKRAAPVIHNYQQTRVEADEFFTAIITPSTGLVEVRASLQVAGALHRTWLREFAGAFDLASFPVSITNGDLTALKEVLNAKMSRFRGKATDGGRVDTVEMTAHEGDDLDGAPEFVRRANNTERVLGELVFPYGGQDYSVRVSRQGTELGSLHFLKSAPEGTIEYVHEALRAVKTRHLPSES